jgi:hypothetical protein
MYSSFTVEEDNVKRIRNKHVLMQLNMTHDYVMAWH